jgi:hypothetical protein
VILRRLRSFVALEPDERRLALRAIIALIRWRVALPRLPVDLLRLRIEGLERRGQSRSPAAIRRAVSRAARTVPGSSCLAQSLAATQLLREAGEPALLSIGVAHPANRQRAPLDAHAWVMSGDLLVAGDGPLERYRELVTIGTSE